MDIDNLDFYYEDCVIEKRPRFLRGVDQGYAKFKEAIRTKLLEVAGRTPERRVVPVAGKEPAGVLP